MVSTQFMIVKRDNEKRNVQREHILGRSETRVVLEKFGGKSFDPTSLENVKLDGVEAARFICDRARQLRHIAVKSDLLSLIWMVENLYYEAYALGCAKRPETIEPSPRRTLSS
jgi:hypothetical protein